MGEPSVPPRASSSTGPPSSAVMAYVEANIDRYTAEALVSAAVAAGYHDAEVRAAIQEAMARRRAAEIGKTARWLVYGAYLLTYLVLSAGLLIPPSAVYLDLGWGAWF